MPRVGSFGRCVYQQGDDAQMLSCLTSPTVVSSSFVPSDWSVTGMLDGVANAQPPFHTLIVR